jgi:hypothetical protein
MISLPAGVTSLEARFKLTKEVLYGRIVAMALIPSSPKLFFRRFYNYSMRITSLDILLVEWISWAIVLAD